MPLALIVAAAENDVIGIEGRLPWSLSADLKRFRSLTMGHCLIMGRRTYESIGRLLPGRRTVIITRQTDYQVEGAEMARAVEEALELTAGDSQPFVVGGAEIYDQFLPWVTMLYLTRVHTRLAGDTRLPPIDWKCWNLVASESFESDPKNEFAYTFETYQRESRVGCPAEQA